ALDRRSYAQRLRRLGEWAAQAVKGPWVLEQVQKLCGRAWEYGRAYAHPEGHRTSNMLDRVMRLMHRYFDGGQHLHGSAKACAQHCRAWALLHNFRPWHPAAMRANGGHQSPVKRPTLPRNREYWLKNLLLPGSLEAYRR